MTDKTGKHVIYLDELSQPHDALITADWGNGLDGPVNLVYVTGPDYTDQYGQQIKRPTSVAYWNTGGYPSIMGNCWCHAEEFATEEMKKRIADAIRARTH